MSSLARVAVCLFSLCCAVSVLPHQTPVKAQQLAVMGLKDSVEVLRDRWGVPHIYAKNSDDLFFVQGYITAQDRLFQLDLWRRIGTGKLAEVLGAQYLNRDRIARLVRYRGDWDQEWRSYSPDAKAIATAFTSGINA
jgi:penicillin amidase